MAFSYIASVQGYNPAIGTTIDCSSALNVQAGDLLVAWVEWQNAESGNTYTVDENDGTDTFTNATSLVINNDIGGGFAYLLSAPTDASFTPRATISASSRRIEMIVLQFRPDSGETVSLDAEGTITSGSGASMSSNNISTTGTDEVVIGAASNTNGGTAFTNEQIGGAGADGSVDGTGVFMGMWYTIYSATQSNINATATGAAEDWVINIISFKSVASGTTLTVSDALHSSLITESTLSQLHNISGNDATNSTVAAELSSFTYIYNILAEASKNGIVLEEPVISKITSILATSLHHNQKAAESVLDFIQQISAESIKHDVKGGDPSLAQLHILLAESIAQSILAEEPNITDSLINLVMQNAVHNVSTETPVLIQLQQLLSESAKHNQKTADTPLWVKILLNIVDSVHSQSITEPGLIHAVYLSEIQDVIHQQKAAESVFISIYQLAIEDSKHDQKTVDALLTQFHTLTADNAVSDQIAASALISYITGLELSGIDPAITNSTIKRLMESNTVSRAITNSTIKREIANV